MKIIITTCPFGNPGREPLDLLHDHGIIPVLNDTDRKYTQKELIDILKKEKPDIIIAGTEKYDSDILDIVPNLKMISRVGIGFDAIDLEECKKRNIIVTITPDAPSVAVAELTICQMINMFRHVISINNDIKNLQWNRYIGREIKNSKIGIIGMGRIGSLVYDRIRSFSPKGIFVNDIDHRKYDGIDKEHISDVEELFIESDIVTIHIPYNTDNENYVSKHKLSIMKKNACLINMSRGGLVNEDDLYNWLSKNKDTCAAIDAFNEEPYKGKLIRCEKALLTSQLGSCTRRSRYGMEVGAVEEAIRFLNNEDFKNKIV